MGIIKLRNRELSYTPIENTFIDNHLKDCSGDALKVYLMLQRYANAGEDGITTEYISERLKLSTKDVTEQLKYWSGTGVINIKNIDNSDCFEIDFKNLTQNNHIVSKDVDISSKFKEIIEEVESLLGKPLSHKEIALILSWSKDFKISSSAIILLVSHCALKGKNNINYIDKIATSWHQNGITTFEEGNIYIEKQNEKWVNYKKIAKYMGLDSNAVASTHINFFEKWLSEYELNLDLIFKATDITVEKLNKVELKYIDGILNNWKTLGVSDTKDIASKVKKPIKKNTNSIVTDTYYNDLEDKFLALQLAVEVEDD